MYGLLKERHGSLGAKKKGSLYRIKVSNGFLSNVKPELTRLIFFLIEVKFIQHKINHLKCITQWHLVCSQCGAKVIAT